MARLEWFLVFSTILGLLFCSEDAICLSSEGLLSVVVDEGGGKVRVETEEDDTAHVTWVAYNHSTFRGGPVRIGEDIEIAETDTIDDDVVVIFGDIYCRGLVTGDAVSVMGNIVVEDKGVIRGDATAVGGRVIELGNGKVKGEVVTVASKLDRFFWNPRRQRGTSKEVSGLGKIPITALTAINTRSGRLLLKILLTLLTVLIGFVIIAIARKGVDNVSATIRKDSFKAGLIGLVTFLVGGLIGILLAITLIGIPISLLIMLVITVGMLLGEASLCVAIGQKWSKSSRSPYFYLVVGVMLVYSIYVLGGLIGLGSGVFEIAGFLVSGIGMLIIVVVDLIGLGGVILSRFGTKAPNSRNLNSIQSKL